MKHLIKLSSWLAQNGLVAYANDIYLLDKFAAVSAAEQRNRDFFLSLFPSENKNKVFAIADQYHKKFRNSTDYQNNIQNSSLDEVISLIKQTPDSALSEKEIKIQKFINEYPNIESKVSELAASDIPFSLYDWALAQIVKDNFLEVNDIRNAIVRYNKEKEKLGLDKFITDFQTVDQLHAYMDSKKQQVNQGIEVEKERHGLSEKYTDIIYSSDNYVVVLSGTMKSSQYWGSDTTWCTGRDTCNLFFNYSIDVFLYYIITKPESKFYDKSNPMRKIAVGYIKGSDGKAKLIQENQNGGTTVDRDNTGLSKDKISSYLGAEGSVIFGKIESDVIRREKTKALDVLEDLSGEEFDEQMHTEGENAITAPQLKKIMDNTQNMNVKLRAAEQMVKRHPSYYFKYELHEKPEYKDLTRKVAESLAEINPSDYFHYKFHEKPEYKDLARKAAESLAKINPYNYFDYKFHENPEYKDLTRVIVGQLIKYSPSDYFNNTLSEVRGLNGVTKSVLELLAEEDSSYFDYLSYNFGQNKNIKNMINNIKNKQFYL